MILMQPIIKDIILSISDDVVSNLTQSFEKTYYGKMNYSSKNTILDSDNKLLKETIGFEIAFIHVITYFLAYSMSCSHEYMHILNILDTDKLFSWFKIKDNSMFLQFNDCNIPTEKEIYELINEHDKFIDKDVKKKLGQFYTPTGIAKKMVFEVRNELKNLSERDLVVDPACGTGVFVVETVKQMSAFLSFDELIKFVENNMFAYDVNPFSVIATKISVLNTLLEIAPDSVHKNNLLLGIPALNNIKWKNTIVDKEEKEFSIILGNAPTHTPEVREGLVRPKLVPELHLIQLCNADAVFVGGDVLRHNVHCHLAEEKVCADSCCCCDTGCFQHIEDDFHGEVMNRELVGVQVVRHIQEHLVDGVDNDVLRGDVLEIDLIDAGAVLHVVRHPRRRDDEVNGQRRVCLQLREEVRCAAQPASRCVKLPPDICFLYALLDFKQPPTPGDTVALEGGCNGKADGLVRPALICNNKICVQRI